jgi:hypothetical protein
MAPHQAEESSPVGHEARRHVSFHIPEHRILIGRRELRERRALRRPRVIVERRKADRIAFAKRSQRADKGAIDEVSSPRLRGAGAVLVARDQAGDNRFEDVALDRGQRFQRFATRLGYRTTLRIRRVVRSKRHTADRHRNSARSDMREDVASRQGARRFVRLPSHRQNPPCRFSATDSACSIVFYQYSRPETKVHFLGCIAKYSRRKREYLS